jgi:hypothetical protein
MNYPTGHLTAAGIAGAAMLVSTVCFAQTVVGPLDPGVRPYVPDSGTWLQYRGGPKSTATADVYQLPPYDLGPDSNAFGYEVGPR